MNAGVHSRLGILILCLLLLSCNGNSEDNDSREPDDDSDASDDVSVDDTGDDAADDSVQDDTQADDTIGDDTQPDDSTVDDTVTDDTTADDTTSDDTLPDDDSAPDDDSVMDYVPSIECVPGVYSGDFSTDAHGITWNVIPEGCFLMGCSRGDDGCTSKEFPRHDVNVAEFEIMATEATQAQFEAVMGNNPTSFPGCPDCAADGLDQDAAVAFCGAIGARLPDEAEWEYAARGGATTRYYCGQDPACLDDIAWYDSNADRPHTVATKLPNDYDLYDTLGNLHEYVKRYTDSSVPDWDYLPLRGAGWRSPSYGLRVSYRHESDMSPWDIDGVRCARDID